MTHDQYWNGDATIVREYRKAEEIRQKRDNYRMWFQGLYFYEAVCDASPLMQAFAKRGTKAHPYPDMPYPISKDEVKDREEAKAKKLMEKNKELLAAFADGFNKRFEKKQEE